MSQEFINALEKSHFKTVVLESEPEAKLSSPITQTFFVTRTEDEKFGLILTESDSPPPREEAGSRYGRINDFFRNRQEVVTFLNLLIRNKVTLTTLNDTFRDHIYERLENAYCEGIV